MKLAVFIVSATILLILLADDVVIRVSGEIEGDLPRVEYLVISNDSEDNLHIVWEDGRDKEVYVYETKWGSRYSVETNIYHAKLGLNGLKLIANHRLTSEGGRLPSIEVDSEDNVWVTYWMNGSFLMKLTTDGDKVFDKKLHNRTEYEVTITMGSDNQVYLSWDECTRLQCFRHFMKLDTDGDILTDGTNVSLVTPVPGFPIVVDDNGEYVYLGDDGAMDSDNNIHIVRGGRDYNLFYTKITNMGEIGTNNSRITYSGDWAPFTRVVIDDFNNIHVVDMGGSGIAYIRLNTTGSVRLTRTGIMAGTEGAAQLYPDLDVDSLGNVYIVWHIMEVIREEPHTGFKDYAYSGYCTKIDSDGRVMDNPWIIARSKGFGIEEMLDLIIPFVIVTSTLVSLMAVGLVLHHWFGRRKGSPKEREGSNHQIRRIKK